MTNALDLTRDAQIKPIYQSMRQGSLRIDIEQVQVVKGASESDPIRIPAWISMKQDRLYLNLRGIPKQADFEEAISHFGRLEGKTITIKASDCFQVQARTESGIPVVLEGVTPVTGRGNFSYNQVGGSRSHEKIDFNRIAFPAPGTDALHSEEHSHYLQKACGKEPKVDTETKELIAKDEFYAVLPEVKQRLFNGGTKTVLKHPFHGELPASHTDCFTGQLNGGEFCLEKHDAGILIDFRCPAGNSTPKEARLHFQGLLQAIAFTHGCNPWPDYFCHRRDHQVIERWVHPRSNLQRHPLRPLPAGELIGHISDKGEKLFLAAANFFAKPSEDAARFNQALWLLREACREDTPQEISVLTLCSVFEGLIKPFRVRKPSGQLQGEALKQFRWIDPIESKLGLSFDSFQTAVKYWDTYRNPLAHGFEGPSATEKSEILDAYAYLFGAVYRVMARKMGFTESLPESLWGNS